MSTLHTGHGTDLTSTSNGCVDVSFLLGVEKIFAMLGNEDLDNFELVGLEKLDFELLAALGLKKLDFEVLTELGLKKLVLEEPLGVAFEEMFFEVLAKGEFATVFSSILFFSTTLGVFGEGLLLDGRTGGVFDSSSSCIITELYTFLFCINVFNFSLN